MAKRKLVIIIVAAILAVAVPVGLIVTLGSSGNGDNTISPAEQYIKLEGDALHALVDSIDETPNTAISSSLSTSTIDIIPSQALFAMLGLGDADMAWAEKITLKMDNEVDGTLLQSLINVGLNDHPILTADLISNSSKGVSYLFLAGIGGQYLKIDQNSIMGGAGGSAISANDLLSQFNVPETKTVKAILNKYIDVALSNMTLVEKTTQDVTVADKTQSVTVYTNYITEKVFTDTIKSILNAVKHDKDIKAILPEGVEIEQTIDELLSSMNPKPSEDKDEAIVLNTYVNSKNEIVGRALAVDREITVSTLTVSDNSGSVSEFSVAIDEVKYALTGSNTSGSGTYSLAMTSGGQTLVLGTLTYTVSGQSGSCELKLSDFIEQNIFGSAEIDPSLKINWSIINSGNTADIDLYLYMMSQQIIGIETSSTVLEGEADIEIPNSSIDITNEDHMSYYLSNLNFTTLEQNMRAAGVPDALVDSIMAQLTGNAE